ncbi:hypothetical protein [Teredinibacter purpureus]|uniref:hypothetical protein n=1 Tax=Teredinibacter purpureus TaxID=2731756 RepID=UPI0005F84EAA|nr:hypothetical protein [Teredinibacter purpureus]
MNFTKIAFLIFSIFLVGCEKNVDRERVRWSDPITADSSDFNQVKIDEWEILTLPEKSSDFILVNKNNGLTFSYDSLGPAPTVMVHQPSGSGQSSIDVIDIDNDGVFDSIRFFSSANEKDFAMYEAKLIDGNWVIVESKKE